jgi:hypothetical protein
MHHVIHGASDPLLKGFVFAGLYGPNDSAQGYVFSPSAPRRPDGVLLAKLQEAIARQSD